MEGIEQWAGLRNIDLAGLSLRGADSESSEP